MKERAIVSMVIVSLLFNIQVVNFIPTNNISTSTILNRFSEEITLEDGTHTLISYVGVQFFWDEELNGWNDLEFEELEQGYLIRNAHITARIYDWYSVFSCPDDNIVKVDDERWIVEVYQENKETWREVDLYSPVLDYYMNETHLQITRSFDNPEGLFNITYILWRGSMLKHEVYFESRMDGLNTFNVIMKMSGIDSNKLTYKDGIDTIIGETHLVSPYFLIGDNDSIIISEYLESLGEMNTTTGEWHSTTLNDIIFDSNSQGTKVDIIIGNYTLSNDESLFIDPDTSCWNVTQQSDDCWVTDNDATHPPWLTLSLTTWDARIGNQVGTYSGFGVRFQNIVIPEDATIDSAYIEIESYNNAPSSGCYIRIAVEDVDDAVTFSSLANYNGRSRTGYVQYIPDAWLNGIRYNSSDLSSIVQTVIDRVGWSSGQDMAFFVEDNTTSTEHRHSMSWDVNPDGDYSPRLYITWTPAPPPPPPDYGENNTVLGQFTDTFRNETFIDVLSDVIVNTTLECVELNYSGGGGLWLDTWNYRKQHTIVGTTVGVQTNYQLVIRGYYGSGTDGTESNGTDTWGKIYFDSKCQVNFGDINFTRSDGETFLDYWIEEKINSSYAIFWVEIDTIPIYPNTVNIYVLYGNSTIETSSDGDLTFPIFIDMEDGTLNEWDSVYGTATKVVSVDHPHTGTYDARLIPLGGVPAPSGLYKGIGAYDDGYAYRVWIYDVPTKVASYATTHRIHDGAGNSIYLTGQGLENEYQYWDGAGYINTGVTRTAGFHYFEYRVNTTFIYAVVDGTNARTSTRLTETVLDKLNDYVYRANPNPSWFDDFIVRKWVTPEPTHSVWGAEESISGYETDGYFITDDYLNHTTGSSLTLLTISQIPYGTSITVQFSNDNSTWVDNEGNVGSTTIIDGLYAIDLRNLNYTDSYNMFNLSGTALLTPRLNQSRLITTLGIGDGEVTTTISSMFLIPTFAIVGLICLIAILLRGRK